MIRNIVISEETRRLVEIKLQLENLRSAICDIAHEANEEGLYRNVEDSFNLISNVFEEYFLTTTQQNIYESKGSRI